MIKSKAIIHGTDLTLNVLNENVVLFFFQELNVIIKQ